MSRVQRMLAVAALAGVLVAATACAKPSAGSGSNASPPASTTKGETDTEPASDYKDVGVTFGQDDAAVNYDKQLVPDGAKLFVAEAVHDGLTTLVLDVRGLLPNRPYGAHAHVKPCGAKPEDAGPHFQHLPDPVKPSVNPEFANPSNEVWLDFTTDTKGNATKATSVEWTFGATPAGSVVIHAEPTKTGPGQAGTAGARAACVSVGF
ncbi:MAG: superoxide dismutase [Pseudonocardia sp.]